MAVMTGGQAVVRALRAEGVDVVFGLPGVQIMHIYDGFFDTGEVRIITVRHEQTATFMADGYARTTGKPGVALVVPGPGTYNAGAGMATAYAASSPVMMIAGQVASSAIGQDQGALHDVHDQLEYMKPVTKWNSRVLAAAEVPSAVHEGMRQLATGRPRPVEIEIPPDVLGSSDDIHLIEPEPYPYPAPAQDLVRRAADFLAGAKRPLIWCGGGVHQSGAWVELRQLAERLNAPVMTTAEGKASLPDNHPLSLGSSGYGWGPAADVVPEADVILAVGTRLVYPGNAIPGAGQTVIDLNIDPTRAPQGGADTLGVPADARVGLDALVEAVGDGGLASEWGSDELEQMRTRTRARIAQAAPEQLALVDAIRAGVPDDGIVVAGVTIMAAWSNVCLPMNSPRSFITPSYMGTLGYAFPTALGAKVGNPDRPVVALCGDGGFMYAASELATAVQYGINVVAVIFNNGVFGASFADQSSRFQGRVVGTELHNPDFMKLAESFGARGMRVEKTADLPGAIQDAIAGERPTVVEMVTPRLAPPYQLTPPGASRSFSG